MVTGRRAKHLLRRRLGGRILSLGACALVAVAQLASFLHYAAVRHERCPEHGDMVDVAFSAPRGFSSAHRDAADTLQAAMAQEDEHDHCSLAIPHPTVTSARALVQVTTLATPLALLFTACARSAVADDVLGDAPKQGPPRSDV